ncbi:hypothetical protein [Desulfopila sp. IMCC35008]|uniref:hypothetical protein n=1 Tax=Desulfopila sp. IMCC35008 TaxID=2653858 RepID=UPI0013D2743B|nr:hypothetical protein [Desulfopila sp. IMCC35008]
MYATQRYYFNESHFRTYFQKTKCYIVTVLDSFLRGVEAAKLAEKNPTDKDAIMRILSDK